MILSVCMGARSARWKNVGAERSGGAERPLLILANPSYAYTAPVQYVCMYVCMYVYLYVMYICTHVCRPPSPSPRPTILFPDFEGLT
jgi:hypothetical protein